jgi:hypothetical protein
MQSATPIPFLKATWVAAWMTGPSASGSLNGMPISKPSTPVSAIAAMISIEVG